MHISLCILSFKPDFDLFFVCFHPYSFAASDEDQSYF